MRSTAATTFAATKLVARTLVATAFAALLVLGERQALAASEGEDMPKKLAELQTDRARPAPSRAQRARWEKELQRRIGKPPAEILTIRNTWTREILPLEARRGARVDAETWSRFLRCHYTNEPTRMAPELQDVLVGAALKFGRRHLEVVSGFRAPKYNLMLRKKGHEVARQSQHTQGSAVDFRIPGVPVKALWRYVKSLRVGGVGYYPDSQFVHADTGRIRYWAGR